MLKGAVLLAGVLSLQAATPAGAAELFPDPFARALQPNATLEGFLSGVVTRMRFAMRRLPDGKVVLSRESIDMARARQKSAFSSIMIMEFAQLDLNRDGRVTKAEIEDYREQSRLPTGLSRGGMQVLKEVRLMNADTDKDGVLTLQEAYAFAGKQPNVADFVDDSLDDYLPLGDGKTVTAAEVIDKALAVFREVDRDSDSVISNEEFAAVARRIRPRERSRLPTGGESPDNP